jgi:hypothetical protein
MTRHGLRAIHPCESHVAGDQGTRLSQRSHRGKALWTWSNASIAPVRTINGRSANGRTTRLGARSSIRELHRNPKSP